MKKYKGFTLIELLVVVLIIGVLATIVTISVMNVQQRGRDARRKSDLSEMFKAISTYSVVNSNIVPLGVQYEINNQKSGRAMCTSSVSSGADPDSIASGGQYSSSIGNGWNDLKEKLGKYMSGGTLPTDPNGRCSASATSFAMANSIPGRSVSNTREYFYVSEWQGSKFSLVTQLENTGDQDRNEVTLSITNGRYKDMFKYNEIYKDPTKWGEWKYLYLVGTPN